MEAVALKRTSASPRSGVLTFILSNPFCDTFDRWWCGRTVFEDLLRPVWHRNRLGAFDEDECGVTDKGHTGGP